MKKTLALAAMMAASAMSANAAYIVTGTQTATTQPTTPAIYGMAFTLSASVILDGFAIYDYRLPAIQGGGGDGWTAAEAKTVGLYSLSGTTYTKIKEATFNTPPGASLTDVITNADMHFGSFAGTTTLTAGTYFLGVSEIKAVGNTNYDGFMTIGNPGLGTPPAATLLGLTSRTFVQLNDVASLPTTFDTGDDGFASGSRFVGVIPSIVAVPEAGSSVMALALGAMVLRFRSRRA